MRLPFLLAATLAAFASSAADAATIERGEVYMAVSRCQPALPAFDGAIRKRPLAMQNEGAGPAFVTCGADGISGSAPSRKLVAVGLVNVTATTLVVNCTLVDGRGSLNNPIQFTKSMAVPANSVTEIAFRAATDNAGTLFVYPATSCSLPPGAGINYIAARFDEEIGA